MKYYIGKAGLKHPIATLVFLASCCLLCLADFLLGKDEEELSRLRGYIFPEKPIPSLGFAPVVPGYIVQLTIKF